MIKKNRLFSLFLVVLAIATSCREDRLDPTDPDNDSSYDWSSHTPFRASYFADLLPYYDGYETSPLNIGRLQLDESSGVCISINNPGMLWTHEDGNNVNFVYLVDANTAEIVCRYRVTGASNIDWEDIEIVEDPQSGRAYLYIADTGDNNENRQNVSVYKFEEPVYSSADYGQTLAINSASLERFNFNYPDGSHDVEAMMIDPQNRDIYFITKRDEASKVYVMPHPYQSGQTNITYWVGDLGFREASAASINFAGDKVVIRNRQNLFYWERAADEAIYNTLSRTPSRLPYIGEVQGEAICFDKEDNYYTTSERGNSTTFPPIYKYIKK